MVVIRRQENRRQIVWRLSVQSICQRLAASFLPGEGSFNLIDAQPFA
jgi:hypothetical protein